MLEKNQKLIVLGAGESGVGAAILAQKEGYEVFVSDNGAIAEKYLEVLKSHKVPFEANGHTEKKILEATEVVKSPGIPDTAALIQKIKQQKIPILSEIEFACRYTDATIIGVTGSNGKTTTAMLVHHILKK